jgi:hypothetical protein
MAVPIDIPVPGTSRDDMQGMISEAKQAVARFGNDLARFDHLVGRQEIARFGKDIALFNQLLALLSEHMTAMYERIDDGHRARDRIPQQLTVKGS